jgi:DNA-binding NtrC family response regulator
MESELFGHEKGSFTGAIARRIGRFEEADGGTLFLDEVGDMQGNMQAKLLRVLQEKEVVRIGSNMPLKTDCRIIVATNKNLKEEVKKGNFREDLYYRLLGLQIELPPLRDRSGDILILARHFIESFCNENELPHKKLSALSQNKLMKYHYPGNVRELKSVIELAVTLSGKDEIEPADLVLDRNDPLSLIGQDNLTMREYELRIVNATIKKYNNDIRAAAEKLNIGVSTIYRMLKEAKE